ncbi:MAG: CDP-glycerol glycerophosphotransferase family protein [Sporolactobacillus sp.]
MNEKLEKYIKKSIHARLLKFDAYPEQWHFSLTFAPENNLAMLEKTRLVCSYRYGEEEFFFPLTDVVANAEDGFTASSTIDLEPIKEKLFAQDYWDFYLDFPVDQTFLERFIQEGGEELEQRLRGNSEDDPREDPDFLEPANLRIRLRQIREARQNLDLFALYRAENDLMIVPFYTKKGSLSLRIEDIHVMARLDHAEISKHFMLKLEGYILFPVAGSLTSADCQKRLLLLDREDQVVSEWRAEFVERPDLTAEAQTLGRNYDWAGFSVEIDLKPIANEYAAIEDPTYLYFRMEFIHPKNGLLFSEESVRILAREKIITGRHIIKINQASWSLIVKRNRNKSAILRIAPYTLSGALTGKIRRLGRRIKRNKAVVHLYHRAFRIMAHFPVKKNLVMFESFFGRQYSCNPRGIYEYMRENCPDYQLIWSANPKYTDIFEAHQVPYVKRFSLKWLFLMTRANYWVINVRLPLWMAKPKHTTYLETWHGTPLKRLALDMDEVHMPGTNTEKYKQNFLTETSRWDYLISPNAYSSEIFARAFGFNNEMVESGYPRNDFLYQFNNKEAIDKIKEQYGLPLDKKIILYAPTWRDNQFYGKGRYKFELDLDLQEMQQELGEDYIVLMRMHYLIADHLDLSEYEGFAYDYSRHEDIRELYLISDILMTDYSSVFFDYANLKRPMIFFTYDIEDYRDNLRGFYFDFEKMAPGPLVMTTTGVIQAVRSIEASGFAVSENFEPFYHKFCSLEDGHSSEKVVKQVFPNL